jgi:hypothetical protein
MQTLVTILCAAETKFSAALGERFIARDRRKVSDSHVGALNLCKQYLTIQFPLHTKHWVSITKNNTLMLLAVCSVGQMKYTIFFRWIKCRCFSPCVCGQGWRNSLHRRSVLTCTEVGEFCSKKNSRSG